MTGVKFPQYTLRERVADGCIHVVGVAASVVALTALLIVGVQAQPAPAEAAPAAESAPTAGDFSEPSTERQPQPAYPDGEAQ